MSKKILYHGSQFIIPKPIFGKGKTYNDYGLGFYCTENIELAKEWATNEGVDGYANKYEIETDNLTILDLSNYSILSWLAILLENRVFKLSSPIEKKGKEYLIQTFTPDYKDFDVIIGYRADDSYFSFARSFLSNTISLRQLSYAMKLGKLGEQFVLKSEKAFQSINFIDYSIADNTSYDPKRKKRDNDARHAFFKELENEDINGLYLRDIIKEGIKPNDERL